MSCTNFDILLLIGLLNHHFILSGPDLPKYLSGHTQLVYNNKVIILGGKGGSSSNSDTWNKDIFE